MKVGEWWYVCMKKKAQGIFSKKVPRILGLVALDVISVVIASLLTLWIRFDFQQIPVEYLQTVTHYLPIDCLIVVAVFAITGLYTSIWRYASVPELITVIGSCIVVDVIIFAYKHALLLPVPKSFWFVFLAFLIFFTCGIRYSYRIGRAILHILSGRRRYKNVMIVGGGEAAHMLIDEINREKQNGRRKKQRKRKRSPHSRGGWMHGNRQS